MEKDDDGYFRAKKVIAYTRWNDDKRSLTVLNPGSCL